MRVGLKHEPSSARTCGLVACAVGLITLVLTPSGGASAAGAPSPFDKPIKTVRVALPRDPDNPQSRPKVSCFYYPRFVVKEVDLGEVDAEQLSIIPASGDASAIACRRANLPSEHVVAVEDWSGYFDGVKGGYVVFKAGDGWNGGLGFAIFNAQSGKKVFDDASKTGFEALQPTPSGLTLRYLRVYAAKCSLAVDGQGCWRQIKAQTGLSAAAPPDCAAAYAREARRTPKLAEQARADPTVIDYEVAVSVQGAGKTITPVSAKAAACRPAD